MRYHYVCLSPRCRKSFTSPSRSRKYCSISCASKETAIQTADAIRAYFLARVTIQDDPLACWPWHGSLTDQGYPMAFVDRGKILATRLSYKLFVGPLRDDQEVLHDPILCNHRWCTNYRHLRPGTHKENMDDRAIAGTLKKGTDHYLSSFTEADVLDVLRMFHEDGLKPKDIANRKGRSIVTIHDIIHRKTWKFVAPGLYPAPTTDGRSHRRFKHTLSEAMITKLCLQRQTDGATFHSLGKAYGIDHMMAERIYNRWLRNQGHTDPKPPAPLKPRVKKWTTSNKQRAKKYGVPSDFTEPQWHVIQWAYGYRCVYCPDDCISCATTSHELTPDHIIPFSLGGPDTASNVVPACRLCNSLKNDGLPTIPIDAILAKHPFRPTSPATLLLGAAGFPPD